MIGRIVLLSFVLMCCSFLYVEQVAARELYCNEWVENDGQEILIGNCAFRCADGRRVECLGIILADRDGWLCQMRLDPCPGSYEECALSKKREIYWHRDCTCIITVPNCQDPVFITSWSQSDEIYCAVCP